MNRSLVSKSNKDVLVNLVVSVARVVENSRSALRAAAVSIEHLKSEEIQNQKTVIALQSELIQSKVKQVEVLQETVKNEEKTFSDVVKQGCKESVTVQNLKAVVKSAVKADDRTRSIMVFGMEETSGEELDQKVGDMLKNVCAQGRPPVSDTFRVGAVKAGNSRPVKVLFHSADSASRVLKSSSALKSSPYSKVFITPDRSPEERKERKKLVEEMKQKIRSEPQRYHFIRNAAVLSREKDSSTPEPVRASTPQPQETPRETPTASTARTNSRSDGTLRASSFQESLRQCRERT